MRLTVHVPPQSTESDMLLPGVQTCLHHHVHIGRAGRPAAVQLSRHRIRWGRWKMRVSFHGAMSIKDSDHHSNTMTGGHVA